MHVRKSECKHGHIFPPDDQCRWSTNWKGYSCRVCNECQRLRMQRKRESPTFREDSNARMRKSRANRGEKYLAEVRELRRTTKEWVDSFKVRCARCPETHVACLDFHHQNPDEKEFLISRDYAKYKKTKLATEIAKCDVLCANCHRKLHYIERQDAA